MKIEERINKFINESKLWARLEMVGEVPSKIEQTSLIKKLEKRFPGISFTISFSNKIKDNFLDTNLTVDLEDKLEEYIETIYPKK